VTCRRRPLCADDATAHVRRRGREREEGDAGDRIWTAAVQGGADRTSQVVGAVGTIVAIVVCGVALVRAETVAARERRITHELEVRRGMAELVFG
jgi:hypothetical protein